MRKFFLLVFCTFVFINNVRSQCPVAGFTLPDSACSGTPVQVTNTSTTGLTYFWDLCGGDMKSTPTSTAGSSDPALNWPQQQTIVQADGNYYLFVVNFFGNSLVRYDYGNSLNNVPVAFTYPSNFLATPIGIDVIKENGVWYAVIVNYGQSMALFNLGSDIAANISSASNITGPFSFNGPRSIEIAFDGTNYYAFVTNDGGTEIDKIEFGNSITNSPIAISAIDNPQFSFTWGIEIEYDCSLNKWIGFVTSIGTSKIHVLDFGSSLMNSPTLVASYNSEQSSGLDLVRDGSHWYVTSVSTASTNIQIFELANNLLDPLNNIVTTSLAFSSNTRGFSVFRDSSVFHGFVTNSGNNSITHITWDSLCFSSPVISDTSGNFMATLYAAGYAQISLQVTDTNGFSSYFTDSIYLNATPMVDFSFSSGCEGLPVLFEDESTIPDSSINFYAWDFGDSSPIENSQNPSHLYSGTGDFLVTLTAASTSGCSSSDTATITINPLPAANFSFTNNQCTGLSVPFIDQSQAFGGNTVTAWQWDFGDSTTISNDQNPFHVFDSAAVYTIELLVTTDAGCVDSIVQQININPTPEPAFAAISTCVGETVTFTNQTTISGGGTITYAWDFGDTGNSTLENPAHTYAPSPGNYDVQLIATSNGCVDTIMQNIRISEKPVPQFSWTPNIVCQGNQVTFTSASTGTGTDTISQYIWDFGDSLGSPDENPFHVYADTGFYNVTLTVVSPTYCDSSLTQQIYVIPGPTASFTASSSCFNEVTSFFPQSVTPPGTTIDSIVWDFGDSTYFNGLSSPTHIYNAAGTYVVTMTLYNNLLCTAQFTDSVTINAIPVSAFTTSIPCSDSPVELDATGSTVAGDIITSYLWDFGGLGTSTDSIATFVFPDSGTVSVTLMVTSSNGCSHTIANPVYITQSPDFDFTFTEPCEGSPTQFTFISNISPPPPATPFWTFGDGNSASIFDPSHLYSSTDSFQVKLHILNAVTGCSADVTKMIAVKPNPTTGFTALPICEELPLQFIDTTTISSGSISSWSWNFGTAGTSSLQNPVITFSEPGLLPVSLTTTSLLGCSTTFNSAVTIYPKPEASFIADPLFGSPPLTVNFLNNTTGALDYTWDFGDNTFGTGTSPGHIYNDTGHYEVVMIATSVNGCYDTTSFSLAVLDPFMDLAVQKIYATVNGDQLRLSADITNQGNLTITSFVIKGIIQGGSIINEYYLDTLKPGITINYQFNASYQVEPDQLPEFYCMEALYPNDGLDQVPENNGKCSVLDNSFEIFTAYPNPFDQELNLNLNLPFEDAYAIQIFDERGRLVLQEENIQGGKGFNVKKVYTAALRKGIYAVAVRYRDDIRVIRILKL